VVKEFEREIVQLAYSENLICVSFANESEIIDTEIMRCTRIEGAIKNVRLNQNFLAGIRVIENKQKLFFKHIRSDTHMRSLQFPGEQNPVQQIYLYLNLGVHALVSDRLVVLSENYDTIVEINLSQFGTSDGGDILKAFVASKTR
jgi:hypothetical protein